MTLARHQRLDDEIAGVVAAHIPLGSYVNLGIGLPTKISNKLSHDARVMLHTENGMLGMRPEASPGQVDPDLVNAGKVSVTELPGASNFHHADSFRDDARTSSRHLRAWRLPSVRTRRSGELAHRRPR